jgi:hypothetical protein
MRKLIILLLLIPFVISARPKRKEFRIKVTRMGAYVVYIPEFREKWSLLGPQWHPINEYTPYHYSVESAREMLNSVKYEDSVFVANAKSEYIFIKP